MPDVNGPLLADSGRGWDSLHNGLQMPRESVALTLGGADVEADQRIDHAALLGGAKHSGTRVTLLPAMIMPSTSSSVTSAVR